MNSQKFERELKKLIYYVHEFERTIKTAVNSSEYSTKHPETRHFYLR